ncbi:MAG: hypothetical protein IJP37_05095 [Clostridia bacterium]|nr:hypothetical protein [Clostridia bacterium]
MKKFVVLLLALSMVLSLCACGQEPAAPADTEAPAASSEPAVEATPVPSEQPEDSEAPAVSEEPESTGDDTTAQTGHINYSGIYEHFADMWDFVFEAGSYFYELPCSLQIFYDDGWMEADPSFNENVRSGDSVYLDLIRDGKKLTIAVYNHTGSEQYYMDCPVGGVFVNLNEEGYHEVSFLGVPVSEYTSGSVAELFGKPKLVDQGSSAYPTCYTYYVSPTEIKCYYFYFDGATGKLNRVTASNYDEDYVDDYGAEMAPTFANMNDNLFDCMVQLDGDIFQLPITKQNFEDNGWTAVQGADVIVQPGELAEGALHMSKNHIVVFDVINFTDAPLPATECSAVNVRDNVLFGDTMPELTLACNIHIGTTQAELEAALPAFEVEEEEDSIRYTVSDPELGIYLLARVDKASGLVDVLDFEVLKPRF